MGLAVFERYGRPSNRVIAYGLAVVLPPLAAVITGHIAALHPLPLALHFIAMALVATYGGLGPALCSVLITTFTQYFVFVAPGHRPDTRIEIMRLTVLFVTAIVISLMTRSRRKTSEALAAALAALREQTEALVESQQASKCASWTYDSRDKTRWFPGGYEVFGMPFSELEELASPIDLILLEDQAAVRAEVARMIGDRSSLLIEYRTVWPNGEVHWSEARGNPLPGNPHVWRGVTFDITERKLAEAALIRSEKLAAMGRLASTVAHEINNPLEAVTNLLYLARSDRSLNQDTEAHLATAEKELARLGNITRLTLGFVRNSPVRADVDLVDAVEDVLSIFHHQLEMKSIQVDRHYEPGVLIDIVPHELRQITINLLSNAADAISRTDALIRVCIAQEQDRAVLTVEDNGDGISEKHLERIFDPFFSTKDDVGTGIGLWVTRELVEKSGGTISVRSGELGGGMRTSFRLEFPASGTKERAVEADLAAAMEASPAVS